MRRFAGTHRVGLYPVCYVVVLFLAMPLDMIAKAPYDNIARNERAPALEWVLFTRAEVLLPLAVSPLILGLIYGFVNGHVVYTGNSYLHTSVAEAPKFGNCLIFRNDLLVAERNESRFRWFFGQSRAKF